MTAKGKNIKTEKNLKYKNINMTNDNRQPCEVYSRVVGWLTPVKSWNKGKRAEYFDRKVFNYEDSKQRLHKRRTGSSN